MKLQTQQKLAELVDQYNRLNRGAAFRGGRGHRQAGPGTRAPRDGYPSHGEQDRRSSIKLDRERRIKEKKEDGFANAMIDVDEAAIPGTGEPYVFPDAKNWKAMTSRRAKHAMELNRRHRSEKEIEIEKKLHTPVNYSCRNRPLSEVLNQLAKLVNVNIHLDDEGLREEGLSPDTPVTLELASDIQLKSYLNLILEKHHLCYIIKNEVLNITSETKKGDHVYQQVYPVGDLVMPIPNFVASPRMGLAGALHDAMGNAVGTSSGFGTIDDPAGRGGQQERPAEQRHDQPGGDGQHGPAPARRQPATSRAAGPGGAGGGTSADFDTLIDLITQTVSPATWDHNGGKGNIAASPTNLSLVVSQTQEVHEEIVDLLEQLRRMQDLQVTIEVRFITLSDSFFERIGVDFDFNIAKNIANPQAAGFTAPVVNPTRAPCRPQYRPGSTNGVVDRRPAGGHQSSNPAQAGIFTTDLSIPFQQGSYALAVPQFGGFDATAGGPRWDSRSSATSRPTSSSMPRRATSGRTSSRRPRSRLFNGQQAFVSDTSQTPFVISVIPVVGDFAAAQQPVIVVLSEGTFMTVQAVVSNDRRFVRLTIVPFFSKIGNVQTFTFQGTDTTTHNTTRNGIVNQATNLFNNNTDQHDDLALRRDGAVADLLVRHRDDDGQRARRRHGPAGRHQALERRPHRVRRADPRQDPLPGPLVQERGHRPRHLQPDDDGHAANHHPGRGRRQDGREHGDRKRSSHAASHRSSPVWFLLPEPSPAHPPEPAMAISWEQGAGSRERGAGSREQGSREQGAGSQGVGTEYSVPSTRPNDFRTLYCRTLLLAPLHTIVVASSRASRLRATCRRRLIVPTGVRN